MKNQDKTLDEMLNEIPLLLDTSISLMPQRGTAINLYNGSRSGKPEIPSFEVDARGIIKYWKDRHPERGYPVTRQENMTSEEFLKWLSKSDKTVVAEVYKNLLEYLSAETPKVHKSVNPEEDRYPMGY